MKEKGHELNQNQINMFKKKFHQGDNRQNYIWIDVIVRFDFNRINKIMNNQWVSKIGWKSNRNLLKS